jgi:hypothetical protein
VGVKIGVKNQTLTARHVGRRLALGVATLLLVLLAADRGRAADHGNAWGQRNQSSARGQATPAATPSQHQPQQRLPWWKDPAIMKEISLTPDQANKIDAIWRKRESDMQAVAKEFERQRDELSRLMAERRVGIDVISIQNDRVEAQRTILNKSRTIMLYQISLILSADQNKALKTYWERNRRDRR